MITPHSSSPQDFYGKRKKKNKKINDCHISIIMFIKHKHISVSLVVVIEKVEAGTSVGRVYVSGIVYLMTI